jgi:hypothetical protein
VAEDLLALRNESNGDGWYTAQVRLVLTREGEGGTHAYDSVFIFRAHDFQHAHRRAVERGRAQESEYLNDDGQRVRWRFTEILTLDFVCGVRQDLDGREVHCSHPPPLDPAVSFDGPLDPAASSPGQTI